MTDESTPALTPGDVAAIAATFDVWRRLAAYTKGKVAFPDYYAAAQNRGWAFRRGMTDEQHKLDLARDAAKAATWMRDRERPTQP